MTAIEGEARNAAPGVLDRGRRPADLARRRRASRSACWFVTPDGLLRLAVEGLAGANLLVGVLNLVPGLPLDGGRVLKAAVWGLTGNAAPRHHRRRLGRPGHRRRRAALAARPGARSSAEPPTSLDFVLAFVDRGCSSGPARPRRWPRPGSGAGCRACVARDLARRTLTVPERPAARRGRTPGPGGRRPAASSPSTAAGAPSASSTRPPCWPRPRTGGPGCRLHGRPHPRGRADAARRHRAART